MNIDNYENREPKYFDLIAMAFIGILLVSNIAAQKLFAFGPFTFTAGILVFPIAYIFGDILTEVYGYARSRRVIWMGLLCNLFFVLIIAIAIWLPPATGWELQEEFAKIFGMVPRIVLASIIAYWIGEFTNSYTLAKMKVLTEGKHLWMRTIGSTLVGQGVDTVVFVFVAFAGIIPTSVLIQTAISGYIFKVTYEIIITPITYMVVGALKKHENINVFDRNTNFNPFRLQAD